MTHELHPDAGALIERLLEREDHQHAIDILLHRIHATGAPRPELGADVVHNRDAQSTQRRHQLEIEIGEIDGNEDMGAQLTRGID
jgi:hypothetical protein